MESLPTPTKLYPYPNGWYVLCKQDELQPGQIIDKKFAGKDIIIFRTEGGKAAATDAYCPHMGAHFAHGGKVQGETIECPFHFFVLILKAPAPKRVMVLKYRQRLF